MRPAGIVLVLSLVFVPILSAAESEFPAQVDEAVLSNGMQVFVVNRPGTPQAACVLAVRTGSSAERAGYTGIAHFLEHMLFKGTDKIGVIDPVKDRELRGRIDEIMAEILRCEDAGAQDEVLAPLKEERDRIFKEQQENLVLNHIFSLYSDAGASMTNAFTSDDMTAFFAVLPPEKVELFFWIEAERFRNPVFRQFHSEKNVVREERRLSENRPGHEFSEELRKVLFGSHPYAHPVIGYHEDLRRLSREDMRDFFHTYYTPDNMFLAITGDVDSERVFALAEKYFGDWKPYAGKRPRIPPVPTSKAGPVRIYGSGAGAASLEVAYRLPPSGIETDVDADLLGMILGDENGALTKRLVTEKGIATRVSASVEGKPHGSVLWISAEMKAGHSPEEAEADVLEAVQSAIDSPVSDDTLASLRRRYRADILAAVKSDMRMGFSFIRHEATGSWRDIERNLARARVVDASAIRALAAEFLTPENRVVGIYETEARPVVATGTRPTEPEARPEPAQEPMAEGRPDHWDDLEFPERAFDAPSGERHVYRLGNGIQVVAVANPADPVFRIEAILRGGSAEDAKGKEGSAALLARTLSLSGMPGKTREQVRESLEEIVGDYGVSAERFALRFSLDTFPAEKDAGLALFHDLLLTSVPDEEVARAGSERMKSRLADSETRPAAMNARGFRGLLWAGDVRTRRATPESVSSIDTGDLVSTLVRHRDPRRAILVVSGAFDPLEMRTRLEQTFGSWRPGNAPLPAISATVPPIASPGLYVMDFDSSQGYVRIGARTAPATDPKHPALWTLQSVLSRRIFNRIRSNEGLAYQAAARLNSDWEIPSLFAVIFQTKNRSVAYGISLALDELEKIAESGPTEEELATARKSNRAGLERTLGRSSARAGAFAELLLHPGTGLDWYPRFRAGVEQTTAEAVRAVAAEMLARDDLVIVCVGKREEMEAGDGEHDVSLSDFGPILELAPPAAEQGPENPTAVVLAVIRAMAEADLDALIARSAGELAENLAEPQAKGQLVRQSQVMSKATFAPVEAVQDGESAEVTMAFEIPRGEETMKMEMLFSLIRKGGAWLCTGFRPKGR